MQQTIIKGEITEIDDETDPAYRSVYQSQPYATIRIDTMNGQTSDLEIPARLLPDGAERGDALTIKLERGE